MVVIPGDHDHGNYKLANGAAGRRNSGFAGCRRVEKISGHQDKLRLVNLGRLADSPNHLETLLLNQRALLGIADPRERFAQLPIGGVQESHSF